MTLPRPRTRDVIILLAIVAILVTASILSSQYSERLKTFIEVPGALGMAGYVFVTIISNVIAPLTVLPLMPVVVALWGGLTVAFLSIFGWTIGAMIIFGLTRRYGRPFVARFVNIERVEEISHVIPEKNFFWIIVLFRLIFPVDLLSFAIGLFTKMSWQPYLAATVLGIAPFAFLLSFGVTLPVTWQIILAVVILAAFAIIYARAGRKIMDWIKK
ncbi:MAG: VTT domain-containing protein [bacterium]